MTENTETTSGPVSAPSPGRAAEGREPKMTGNPAIDNLRQRAGIREYTCGLCGEEFGSNCDPGDIQCTADECEARLCPCCGAWFTEDGDHSEAARLRGLLDEATRERDEARAEAARLRELLHALARRLEDEADAQMNLARGVGNEEHAMRSGNADAKRDAARRINFAADDGCDPVTPRPAPELAALLDEVLDDIEHVVDGNPDWIDRSMLTDYSERAAAIAAVAPAELKPAPELAAAMAETRRYREKLTAARDRLDQLAAYFEESAKASSPSKKSEIERHAARAVREAAAGIGDGEPQASPPLTPVEAVRLAVAEEWQPRVDALRAVAAEAITMFERLMAETPFEFRPDIDTAQWRQRAGLDG